MYRLGVKELIDRFRDGRLSCEGYARRVIQRAEDLKVFNYFVFMDTERMLKEAKEADVRYQNKTNRPLEGIPIAFKDNIDIQGESTGACTAGLAGLKPKHTAEVAQRLFDAGAIHAGRTNMDELATGVSTTNAFTGASHNFHNFDHMCGGSSGGSCGAVAADIVPVALGSDTGGSIRIPSSYSGTFGLRPTIGRWPKDYGVKMTHLRDSVGPLARSADDIAFLDQVMTGEAMHKELAPGNIRIGVPRFHFWDGLDPEVETYSESFLIRLKQKGFVVIDEGEIPGVDNMFHKYMHLTINHELKPRLKEYLKYHGHDTTAEYVIDRISSPYIAGIFNIGAPSAEVMQAAMAAREKLIEDTATYFEKHNIDCILMPASKIPPPTLSAFEADTSKELHNLIMHNYDSACICNNPSLVIPGGISKAGRVPFGMQLEGTPGTDRRLIAVARAIEKALEL